MMALLRAWGLTLVLGFLSEGCTAYSLLGGAQTLPKGDWEVAVLPGVSRDPLNITWGENRFTAEALVRRGFSDRFDLGLRLFSAGAALEGRFQIYSSAEEAPALNALVSLSPGIGGGGATICTYSNACSLKLTPYLNLSVVVGIRLTDFVELLIAQRTTGESWEPGSVAPGGPGFVPINGAMLNVGGDLAVVFHLPHRWRLAPEATLLVPVVPIGLSFVARLHFGLGLLKDF